VFDDEKNFLMTFFFTCRRGKETNMGLPKVKDADPIAPILTRSTALRLKGHIIGAIREKKADRSPP
jgi:hypothetical protein